MWPEEDTKAYILSFRDRSKRYNLIFPWNYFVKLFTEKGRFTQYFLK